LFCAARAGRLHVAWKLRCYAGWRESIQREDTLAESRLGWKPCGNTRWRDCEISYLDDGVRWIIRGHYSIHGNSGHGEGSHETLPSRAGTSERIAMFVKELVRKVLGVVLGFLLSCVLTFIIINAYSFNLGIESLARARAIAQLEKSGKVHFT